MTEPHLNDHQRIDYAARRRERALQKSSATTRKVPYLVIGVLVAVIAVALLAEVALSYGRIHRGVTISGIEVGGMKPANAGAALRTSLPSKVSKPVTLVYGDQKWKTSAEKLGLTFDYDAEVARAMRVGRSGDTLQSLRQRAACWFGGVELRSAPSPDPDKFSEFISDVAQETDVAFVNARVKLDGTTPKVVPGSDGRALDKERARTLIMLAFTDPQDRTFRVPVVVAPKQIDEADAEKAAAVAKTMLSKPVTLTHGDKEWEFDPSDIADWITFSDPADASGSVEASRAAIEPRVSAKLAEKPVKQALGDAVGRPAKDARFTTAGGRVKIIPSKTGIGADMKLLALSLTRELKDAGSDHVVEVRTHRVEPEITTEKAQSMGIKERISTFTTTFDGSNRPRTNNIHLLGEALDGTLIEPGGTFSFNGAAGERTAEKGYQEANAIVKGKLVPQLGGGVCQVGTTVFNAVFQSGLPVVERHNHSFYISHYPKGRDATVSWGGPDLKFKNDTDSWILVSVAYTSYSITVSLYGTDPGYEVSSEASDWRNMKPFPTEEVKDAELAKGSKVVEDSGITGRTITVKRTVRKDGNLVRTDNFVSVYKPKIQVVRIGTKPVPEEEEPANDTP